MNPGMVFDKVGVDYTGPIMVKIGPVHRPVIMKAYMCVIVSFTVKAVHLEAGSELTTVAFIACLHKFVARRGKSMTIWSDHGTISWELPENLRIYTHTTGMSRQNLQSMSSVLIKAFGGTCA